MYRYGPHFEIYFNLLYTVYSIPNCILPLFGGILSDKMGNRRAIMLFASLIAAGQLLGVVGAASRNMMVMLAGPMWV